MTSQNQLVSNFRFLYIGVLRSDFNRAGIPDALLYLNSAFFFFFFFKKRKEILKITLMHYILQI
jgi:hypothetical protein